MSSQPDTIKVSIFGTDFSIKADVDSETTLQVAEYVNAKMSETYKTITVRDTAKIATLTAMNITGDLFEARKRTKEELVRIEECKKTVSRLILHIDSALDN